jgi:hypothetical protein
VTLWIPATDGFIAADVVRWKETVFKPRRARKGKAVRQGERLVTAEVIRDGREDGWSRLLVRACETASLRTGTRSLPVLTKNEEIKRARKTILIGQPERLLWSDESARAVVASGFIGMP